MNQEIEIKHYIYPLSETLKIETEKLLKESFGVASDADPKRIQAKKENHYTTPVECLLAFLNDELIGIQMIFLRNIIFENQPILIGGLGGLCVKKEYRNQGIAKKLLSAAVTRMQNLSCDISMLFTNIHNPRYIKLYGMFEFAPLHREYSFINKSGELRTAKSAMIAPINSKEKYNLITNSTNLVHIGDGEW